MVRPRWHATVCPKCKVRTIRSRRGKKRVFPLIAVAIVLALVSISHAPVFRMVEDLGTVRVTNYTHIECGGNRVTASGYELKDGDARRVCAVSRDLLGRKVRFGDHIYLERYGTVCEVLDTMADVNRKGFPQRKWVDVYMSDYDGALGFGIQKSRAWVLRSATKSLRMNGG